jgi:hypothetical protein
MTSLLLAAILAGADAPVIVSTPVEAQPPSANAVALSIGLVLLAGAGSDGGGGAPAAGIDGTFLVHSRGWMAGARIGTNGSSGTPGTGGGVLAGAELDLSDSVRLEVLGELGAQHYSKNGSTFWFVSTSNVTGSDRTQLAVGARAGLTSRPVARGSRFTAGLFARYVETTRATYQEQTCNILVFCSTQQHVARYGGPMAGLLLSWTWDWRVDLQSPAAPGEAAPPQRER